MSFPQVGSDTGCWPDANSMNDTGADSLFRRRTLTRRRQPGFAPQQLELPSTQQSSPRGPVSLPHLAIAPPPSAHLHLSGDHLTCATPTTPEGDSIFTSRSTTSKNEYYLTGVGRSSISISSLSGENAASDGIDIADGRSCGGYNGGFVDCDKYNCVLDGWLFLGPELSDAELSEAVAQDNFGAIVSLTNPPPMEHLQYTKSEFSDPNDAGLRYARFQVADTVESPIETILDSATQFIHEAHETHGLNVYVHCHAGISRSPTVVAAYLMRYCGMSQTRALAHIQKQRPCISPNIGFVGVLMSYETRLARESSGQSDCSSHRNGYKRSNSVDDIISRDFALDKLASQLSSPSAAALLSSSAKPTRSPSTSSLLASPAPPPTTPSPFHME